MTFIDSYKRLEKLCSDIYGQNHAITAYIDEMINTPSGSFHVYGWDADLKKLKHCRWARNKIVHELGYTEENTCEPDDLQWINDFYSRILTATDPLALYRKEKERQTRSCPKPPVTPRKTHTHSRRAHVSQSTSNFLAFLTLALFILFILLAFTFATVRSNALDTVHTAQICTTRQPVLGFNDIKNML